MLDQTKSRLAVDLDDLERQLRQTASAQPKAVQGDPLAELARIVGQDDPFKAMFAERQDRPAPAPESPRVPPLQVVRPPAPEPAPEPALLSDEPIALGADGLPSLSKSMMDEFDALLRAEIRGPISDTRPVVPERLADEPVGIAPDDAAREGEFAAGEADPRAEPRQLDGLPRDIYADERVPPDGSYAPPPTVAHVEQPAGPQDDLRSLEPRQPGKGLVIAGALLGVAVLGIGAVIGLRSFSGPVRTPNGEPPLIKAEAGPVKVAPLNPGGVEIPNQNKQILERTPEPRVADTRVVNREEQPVDVQAIARSTPRVILPRPEGTPEPAATPAAVPPSGTPSASPPATVAAVSLAPAAAPAPATPAAAPALGEPRRVRTVAVRPDGSIAPVNAGPAAAAPVVSAPPASSVASAPAPAPALPAVATVPSPAPRPPAVTARPAPIDEKPATRPAAPPIPARQQIAAAPAMAPTPAPAGTTRATDAEGGGFMVQLGAPGSESEARASFAALQRRFGDQLSGESPTIRRAELGNGRTVYRLRVGPYSREDAAEKCQALQAAGGQCFVARN
jgi:hypothetical protein